MFFGMMLVDAALAAWAVGLMGQPGAPKWTRYVLVWIGASLITSVVLVLATVDPDNGLGAISMGVSEKNASLIGPAGAIAAMVALTIATLRQQRNTKR